MRKFRVVYKKWHELQQAFALIEEDIEAAAFTVEDGNLVFSDENGDNTQAIPAGGWAGIEPATVTHHSLIT